MQFFSKHNLMVCLASSIICGFAYGEPTLEASTVETLRIIPTANMAYVQVTHSNLCDTVAFSFKVDTRSGIAMYSTLLLALKSKSNVRLEVNTSKGCTGWGPDLNGVTIL